MPEELRILILGDIDGDAGLITHELRKAQIMFSSMRADMKQAFLDALKDFAPDVILAGHSLLQFTAPDALQLLKDQQYEIPLILVAGSQAEEITVVCIKEGTDDSMLNEILDKKRREKAEELSHPLEGPYRLITENTRDLIALLDLEGHLLYLSPSCQDMLGYTPEELIGRPFFSLTHPEDQEMAMRMFRQTWFSEEGRTMECRYQHQTAEWRVFESAWNWIPNGGSIPEKAVMVSRDITERKITEERLKQSYTQLRELASHLQFVREEERTHIAREIHDDLGQTLTGLKMDLAWLEYRLSKLSDVVPSSLVNKIPSMSHLVDETIQSVRRIATELRPSVLDDLGLVAAIEWQTQEFQARTGIRCVLTPCLELEDIDVPQSHATAVFRIFQETLTNVARHANATKIHIRLKKDVIAAEHPDRIIRPQDALLLEVEDNGTGITEQALSDSKSLGLLGMRERALLLGGEVTIKGIKGKGTIVTVRVPLVPD